MIINTTLLNNTTDKTSHTLALEPPDEVDGSLKNLARFARFCKSTIFPCIWKLLEKKIQGVLHNTMGFMQNIAKRQ